MPTNKESNRSRMLMRQHVGFLLIAVICYLDDLLKLPALIFYNHPFAFDFRKAAIELLLILAVWLLVSSSTRRLLQRVHYLEGFVRVCAWCRHVDYKSQWMPMEEFLLQGFDTPTTHGICPECLAKQKAAIEKAKRARRAAS